MCVICLSILFLLIIGELVLMLWVWLWLIMILCEYGLVVLYSIWVFVVWVLRCLCMVSNLCRCWFFSWSWFSCSVLLVWVVSCWSVLVLFCCVWCSDVK